MKKYTKPALRERIKARVLAGTSGGKAGQWSARKAQLVAAEYKKSGGGYSGGKSSTQRSLTSWTKEDWATSDDKPAIRKTGTTRYLPRAAWRNLTTSQREATNRKKREGADQFVSNTKAAKAARKRAVARARGSK